MPFSMASLALGAAVLVVASAATARQSWRPDDGADGGRLLEIAHKHAHKSGHDLLGDKLRHDGRHEVDKVKGRSVTADVKGGKVVGMGAGDLKMRRVKASHKMAEADGRLIRVASRSPFQLAQNEDGYYGYCFDDEVDDFCYWYPASDIDYQDYSWESYDDSY
jgi:hypothetical protein